MQDIKVAVNADSQAQIQYIGREQTPIMIFDNFALGTENLIQFASELTNFSVDEKSYYPGLRSPLPRQYVIDILQSVYQQICVNYQIPQLLKLQVQPSYFSLLTHAPKQLSLLQRLPHFDTSNPYYFAVLHYLNAGHHGNTGFFRHKPTEFERITHDRVDKYLTSANQAMQQQGEPELAYIVSSNAQYELYHQVEYKPNRLVIYPGNMLHSTIVCPATDIDANPLTGRLTANIFIDFM